MSDTLRIDDDIVFLAALAVLHDAVLNGFERNNKGSRTELLTHLIKVKDNDPVVNIHICRVREHIQAALRNKLCCQRNLPRFGVWLLQHFRTPVGQ